MCFLAPFASCWRRASCWGMQRFAEPIALGTLHITMLTRTSQDSTSAAAALAPVVEVSGLSRAVAADDGNTLHILDDVSC